VYTWCYIFLDELVLRWQTIWTVEDPEFVTIPSDQDGTVSKSWMHLPKAKTFNSKFYNPNPQH
jgi:hypothetical protein